VLRTLAIVSLICAAGVQAESATDAGADLFRQRIQPLLERNCYECHSANAKKVKGDLLLDTREGLLKGGQTGPAVVPGDPAKSLLVRAVRHEDDLAMPPKKPKLADDAIADLVKWVQLGAPDPRGQQAAAGGPYDLAKARQFWSFQPVRPVTPPPVKDTAWVRTDADRFVLAKIEGHGLRPAAEASKAELIRRVTFDLTGLPPTPGEIDAFLADSSPDAYEKLVDRLLASPHFGERQAQHWLDVVRYAESEGFEYDRHLSDAWRYRDYVVNAFNADKPYDQFVREQIAGDEIKPDDPECQTAAIFHRLGPVRRNSGNPEIALSRNEVLTERTDVIGAAFLGLTVGCARCHDHKLDPISQKDYYRLEAYMAATQEHDISLAPPEAMKAWEEKTKAVNDQVKQLRKEASRAEGARRQELKQQAEDLEDSLPPRPPTIPGICDDAAQRTEVHVLRRGDWDHKADAVAPRPPSVLVSDDYPELPADKASPRIELARWITDPRNPLTARVIVNRLWQSHFGTGLVKTPNDFGSHGDRPSHPELLDWLATQLVQNGWHLKPIHRLILLSSAYRQSSRSPSAEAASKSDPDNRLLWHFNRRRLSAEEIRDAMLAASGKLNPQIGGPSVMVPVDPEMTHLLYKPSQWQVAADAAQHCRRSIYLIAKRNLRLPFMETFDQPAMLTSCGRRESSTHAPQALEMLNGTLSNDLAAAFAERLQSESPGDPDAMVTLAFRLAAGRPPTTPERTIALAFLKEERTKEFALAVFNLNAFLYVQ